MFIASNVHAHTLYGYSYTTLIHCTHTLYVSKLGLPDIGMEVDKTAEVEVDKSTEVESDKTTEVEADKIAEVEAGKTAEVGTLCTHYALTMHPICTQYAFNRLY